MIKKIICVGNFENKIEEIAEQALMIQKALKDVFPVTFTWGGSEYQTELKYKKVSK